MRALANRLHAAVPRSIRARLSEAYVRALPSRPGSVAMLHTGRNGSTVLANLLRQHPALLWDGELFEKLQKGQLQELAWTRDPFVVLRNRMRHAAPRIYGFETKAHRLQHLSPKVVGLPTEAYVARLHALGFSRFIVLRRRNYLRQAVSAAVGRAAKRRHIYHGEERALTQIHLDIERTVLSNGQLPLLDRFREFDALYAELGALLAPEATLELEYESHIEADPGVAYGMVCVFLGLPARAATTRLVKTNPYPLREIVLNHDEVARVLRDTPYAWMLDEAS